MQPHLSVPAGQSQEYLWKQSESFLDPVLCLLCVFFLAR